MSTAVAGGIMVVGMTSAFVLTVLAVGAIDTAVRRTRDRRAKRLAMVQSAVHRGFSEAMERHAAPAQMFDRVEFSWPAR